MSKAVPLWSERIRKYLENLGPRAFNTNELAKILSELRTQRQLPSQASRADFLEAAKRVGLQEVELRPTRRGRISDKEYKPFKRYTWGNPTSETIALSLRANSYLSHRSAASINGLLKDAHPKTIFVNREQTPKPTSGVLTQEAIHRAFTNHPRESNLRYRHDDAEIILLSGKHTDRCGVISQSKQGEKLDLTDVNRTLLDLAVRPVYCEGANNVLLAFKEGQRTVEPAKLARYLEELDYSYPYNQVVGFYMSRAGYPAEVLKHFHTQMLFDFHLAHSLEDAEFDTTWRIFAPRHMVRMGHTSPT